MTVAQDPLAPFRAELLSHCYRMMGSAQDAEDALQEVSVRAWRGRERFEGRSSLRTWLHKIANNVCLNELDRKERRVLPVDVSPEFEGTAPMGEPLADVPWISPLPDDPEATAEDREAVELALVAAMQHLAPNQRAALLMFEVLDFSAAEIAEAMDTSTASVNSALQRARAQLKQQLPAQTQQAALDALGDDGQRRLVAGYTDALRHHDVDAMLELLTEDATWAMPPLPNHYRGREAVAQFLVEGPYTVEWRHRPTRANGQLAVACYSREAGTDGPFEAFCIDVLDLRDGRVAGVMAFIDAAQFPRFGLPPSVPAE